MHINICVMTISRAWSAIYKCIMH